MKRIYTICLIILIHVLTSHAQNFSGNLTFSANMDGSQESPPVSTTAMGVAGFVLNVTHDTLCVNVSVIGLSGPITASHFHFGPPGVSGPVWLDLTTFISGNRIIGTIVSPPDSVLEMLMSGLLYINVHTSANPAGEIRGQIYLESDVPLSAILDGNQETPPVVTSAYGYATLRMSKGLNQMNIKGVFSGLPGAITGIHLHNGASGVSGPVVEDLMPGLVNNILDIDVNPGAYLSDLINGNIYLNVHTAMNPNGEIRGQVLFTPLLTFEFIMTGLQEVPPNPSQGTAVGNVWMASDMDSLYYYIAVDTLTSAFTAAHLHLGAPGVSGSVLVPLMGNGNILQGFVADSSVTLELVKLMLEGMVYANIHTTNFPAGELRGQLKRVAREGFTFEINGNNEVPPVPTNATGFGVASLDGESESLYYSLLVSELDSPLTAAHFHHGASGQSGPPIFTINNISNNFSGAQAMGFWTSADTVSPLTTSHVAMLFSDSVYFNVHTISWPGGEARGQLTTGGLCSSPPVFINEIIQEELTVNAYPNPVTGILNLDVNTLDPGESIVMIYDLTGRLIFSKAEYLAAGINHSEIDVSIFDSGAYLIRFEMNDIQIFGKFVKE